MYELDGSEIRFKLRTKSVCYLESDPTARMQVLKDIRKFYYARSTIVHKPWNQAKINKNEAFYEGFELARRSLFKLLCEEDSQDWGKVVMVGTKHHQRKSHNSAGTTEPGFRNRNGQVVVKRTDIPGNDHNQYVYVLECSICGQRYGANGSDIWQRKCPACGGGLPGLNFE